MREIIIKSNDGGQRLDKFLGKLMPTLPLSLMHKYLRKKCVKINGKHITNGAEFVNCGDILNLYISDEFFDNGKTKSVAAVSCKNLDVVFEDENILIVNKPCGMSVHADETQSNGTLIDLILSYLYGKGEYSPESEQSFVPALCNRIDRNTAGLVIAAKNSESLREMNNIIKNREVVKKYKCLVHGELKNKSGTLKHFLLKDEKSKTVTVFDKPMPDAKTAVLDYIVLDTFKLSDGRTASQLDITLHTGRTHQIRAQFAHIGNSLVGDGKYGKEYSQDKKCGYLYQALAAYSLTFKLTDNYELLGYLDNKNISIQYDLRRQNDD